MKNTTEKILTRFEFSSFDVRMEIASEETSTANCRNRDSCCPEDRKARLPDDGTEAQRDALENLPNIPG
jgi:hypothetical protein